MLIFFVVQRICVCLLIWYTLNNLHSKYFTGSPGNNYTFIIVWMFSDYTYEYLDMSRSHHHIFDMDRADSAITILYVPVIVYNSMPNSEN